MLDGAQGTKGFPEYQVHAGMAAPVEPRVFRSLLCLFVCVSAVSRRVALIEGGQAGSNDRGAGESLAKSCGTSCTSLLHTMLTCSQYFSSARDLTLSWCTSTLIINKCEMHS